MIYRHKRFFYYNKYAYASKKTSCSDIDFLKNALSAKSKNSMQIICTAVIFQQFLNRVFNKWLCFNTRQSLAHCSAPTMIQHNFNRFLTNRSFYKKENPRNFGDNFYSSYVFNFSTFSFSTLRFLFILIKQFFYIIQLVRWQ